LAAIDKRLSRIEFVIKQGVDADELQKLEAEKAQAFEEGNRIRGHNGAQVLPRVILPYEHYLENGKMDEDDEDEMNDNDYEDGALSPTFFHPDENAMTF